MLLFKAKARIDAYEQLLHVVLGKCEEHGIFPDPRTIVRDLEMTTLQAVSSVFGQDVTKQGCFYHLSQSIWRNIQELGLVNRYNSEAEIKHFCGMLDGLALLPVDKVSEGMNFLRNNTPDGLDDLVNYFDSTYVSGSQKDPGSSC